MQTSIPRLTYLPKTPSGGYSPCIKVNGKVVHHIEDLGEFHKVFGYTQDIAKAGILPDEFIWEEYFKGIAANRTACFQVHLIEYLLKHSALFRKEYADQCESWIIAHAEARSACGEVCCACKTKRSARNDS